MHEDRPPFDRAEADAVVGKVVLIGLTIVDPSTGAVEDQQQFYGRVVSADERDGFALDLLGEDEGQSYHLPPDTSALRPAPPGVYRLRSTGAEIHNPDYLTSWTIERPRANDNDFGS